MEKYIERCYISLKEQQGADNCEFIFVNDGSRDSTLSILREFEKEDKRVIIIDQNNSGVSAARNAALKVAKGEYIYLLDADDYLVRDAICNIVENIRVHHPDIIMSAYNISKDGTEVFCPLGIREGIFHKSTLFSELGFFPTIPQLVYRNDYIHKYDIKFDITIKCGEVYGFTINYLKYANTISVINHPSFNYYIRPDSAIHKPNHINDMTVIQALETIYDNGKDLSKYISFDITAFRLAMSFTYNKYVKNEISSDTLDVIPRLLSNPLIKYIKNNVLFKCHGAYRDRFLALYISLMPAKFGIKLLNRIYTK